MTLVHNPILLLLVIVILGETLGRVRLWSLTLGPAAIVFVALAFGHFGYTLPQGVQTIGLALFIYAVGLQAGPGFVSSFRRHGLPMALGVIAMVAAGTATAYACCRLFGFDAGTGAGLLAGGADGLIVEVHPDPPRARSDAQQQLRFDQFADLMQDLVRIAEISQRQPR